MHEGAVHEFSPRECRHGSWRVGILAPCVVFPRLDIIGPSHRPPFRDSGLPLPHLSWVSRNSVHESIGRSGASSLDRGFLHHRLSTISVDTLGI